MEQTIKYPWMREQLIGSIETLSDIDYQRKAWVQHEFPEGVEWDDLDLHFKFLFDGPDIYDYLDESIGDILKNETELKAVKEMLNEMMNIFKEYGTELTDEEYINLPEWQEVIEKAKIVKEIVK